jgi:predicted dinucleotide-binding enzyme
VEIGIIGSGRIGATVARLFVRAGHSVSIANSRGPESLAELVDELGAAARAATPEDAVSAADVVLLAVPWRRRDQLPAAGRFAGKIVVDATNPYAEGGGVADLGDGTSSEEVARQLAGARLVKAFNTMHFQTLATAGRDSDDGRLVLFVAGDDDGAKRIVSDLIREIGFDPVDTGRLREGGRKQQPGSPIYNRPLTRPEAEAALAELA